MINIDVLKYCHIFKILTYSLPFAHPTIFWTHCSNHSKEQNINR